MHARRPAAGHEQEVTGNPLPAPSRRLCRREIDDPHMPPAEGSGWRDRRMDDDPGVAQGVDRFALRLLAQVADRRDGDASPMQVERGAIRRIVGGHDDGARSRLDAVAVEIGPRRTCEHHPRPVVFREDQRPLDRPTGKHHFLCPHLPEALARQPRIGIGKVVGNPLAEAQEILRVVAEGRGPREQRHVSPAAKCDDGLGKPVRGTRAVDRRRRLVKQRPTELRLLVAKDHPGPGLRRGASRGQSRRAAADDQDVAMGVARQIAVRVGGAWRPSEAGAGADRRLVEPLPPAARPHEGLVVEAGADQRREKVRCGAEVEVERRPAILAARNQALMELDLGGAEVGGLASATATDGHQGVRLLDPGRQDSTRPVVFERAADEMDAVRQQRRGERVAGISFIRPAVEGETQRPGTVDPSAGRGAEGSHGGHRRRGSGSGRPSNGSARYRFSPSSDPAHAPACPKPAGLGSPTL